jgi:hypothetical protein
MAIMLERKPTQHQGWHLLDAAAMLTAFEELKPSGWRGGLSADEGGAWRLELNANDHVTITAQIGQWLVLDGQLRVLGADECAELYDEVVT